MSYFDGFAEALDPDDTKASEGPKLVDPGQDRLPFDLLDDRRFEILAYRLKCAQFGSGARVTLMQGVGERGRDVLVRSNAGAVTEVLQCKCLKERLTAPALRAELLKLALHAYIEPAVLGDGPVRYELWCPGGLTAPAAEILARWPRLWTDAALASDAEEVIAEYAKLNGVTWGDARTYVVDRFPTIVTAFPLENVDIAAKLRQCPTVYRAFFQGHVVADVSEVEGSLRRIMADLGGHRELTDKDAKHVLERVHSFAPAKRLVFHCGYVMGPSPALVSKFNREEYKLLATYAIQATTGILNPIMTCCSRLAFKAARDFRVEVSPTHLGLVNILVKTLNTSMLARVTGMVGQGLKLQPGMEAYAKLAFRARMNVHVEEMWDEYERCLAGFDPSRHPFGSDEECRVRIVRSGLGGASTKEELEGALNKAIEEYAPELERRFNAYMDLVPEQLLVITDTTTAFENDYLMKRMAESVESMVKLRGSAIIPE
jgi:hypothetical protein